MQKLFQLLLFCFLFFQSFSYALIYTNPNGDVLITQNLIVGSSNIGKNLTINGFISCLGTLQTESIEVTGLATFSNVQLTTLSTSSINSNAITTNSLSVSGQVNAGSGTFSQDISVNGVSFSSILPSLPAGQVMTIQVRGTGLDWPNNNYRHIIVNGVDYGALTGRGFQMVAVDRFTGALYWNQIYDTYASTAASEQMATDINNLNSSYVVILASFDAIYDSITPNLTAALLNLGASYRIKTDFYYRTSYALVAVKGQGPGSGQETMIQSGKGVAEVAALLINGYLVAQNNIAYCPSSWIDLGNSCIEPSAPTESTWQQAALRCYNEGARMCTAYEVFIASTYFANSIGFSGKSAYIDQVDPINTDSSYADFIVVMGNPAPSSIGNLGSTSVSSNIVSLCCIDK